MFRFEIFRKLYILKEKWFFSERLKKSYGRFRLEKPGTRTTSRGEMATTETIIGTELNAAEVRTDSSNVASKLKLY